MHRIRIWIRAFFGFSRKETNAFLVLLPLMIVVLVSEPVYRHWKFRNDDHNFFDQHYADSVLVSLSYPGEDSVKAATVAKKEIPFTAFDPNTISERELVDFGLSSFLARRVVRYREKGGAFKNKNDLLRIYGMDSSWFKRASRWISLPEKSTQPKQFRYPEKKIANREIADINVADSIQLVNIFGVGPALSRRIRNYREKLGGFISMEQLNEVYGLDSATLKELKKRFTLNTAFMPRQISVNSETIEELIHPYMKKKEAQAIINYRKQHGNFESLEEILAIEIVSREWLERIRPYLKL